MELLFPDSFIFYRPKAIVSGDFYWFVDRGDKFILAAVDCTGHGVPGAFMSVIGSNFLSQIVNEFNVSNPQAILDHLDFKVKSALRQKGHDASVADGMEIALCVIDKPSKTLYFAGANRPVLLIQKGKLTRIKGTLRPIGGKLYQVGKEPPFKVHKMPLNVGDRFYIFSDGIVDQFGGPMNKKFTSRRLRELIALIYEQPMKTQKEIVIQTLEKWRKEEEQTDDLMMIGIHIDETAWENME